MPNRQHIIVPRTQEAAVQGITTRTGEQIDLSKGFAYTSDESLVADIDSSIGLKGTGEVFTHEDQRATRFVSNERGEVHKYFFGRANRRYANNYERIFKHG